MSEFELKPGTEYILTVPKTMIDSPGILLVGTLKAITSDGLYVIGDRKLVSVDCGTDIGTERARGIARYLNASKEQRKAMESVSNIPGVIYLSKPIAFIEVK